MRICIQSGTPLSQSALYKPYHDSLLRHAHRVASPGTTVEFPNLGKQYPGAARSRTHLHLVQHETIKSALRAQDAGYDVFVTQCLDLGYHELREMVKIPVVFMTQATLAFYSQLAPNFAFLVNSERLLHYFGELADRYKARERMVPGSFVSFAFTDYANLWNQPQPFIDAYLQVAGRLADQGAWLKLSGWYRLNSAAPFDDVQPAIAALHQQFAGRCVWGSDWPHTRYFEPGVPGPVPGYADLMAPARATLQSMVGADAWQHTLQAALPSQRTPSESAPPH